MFCQTAPPICYSVQRIHSFQSPSGPQKPCTNANGHPSTFPAAPSLFLTTPAAVSVGPVPQPAPATAPTNHLEVRLRSKPLRPPVLYNRNSHGRRDAQRSYEYRLFNARRSETLPENITHSREPRPPPGTAPLVRQYLETSARSGPVSFYASVKSQVTSPVRHAVLRKCRRQVGRGPPRQAAPARRCLVCDSPADGKTTK